MSKDAGERLEYTEIKKGESQNWLELWTEQKQNPLSLVKTNPIHFEENYKKKPLNNIFFTSTLQENKLFKLFVVDLLEKPRRQTDGLT